MRCYQGSHLERRSLCWIFLILRVGRDKINAGLSVDNELDMVPPDPWLDRPGTGESKDVECLKPISCNVSAGQQCYVTQCTGFYTRFDREKIAV